MTSGRMDPSNERLAPPPVVLVPRLAALPQGGGYSLGPRAAFSTYPRRAACPISWSWKDVRPGSRRGWATMPRGWASPSRCSTRRVRFPQSRAGRPGSTGSRSGSTREIRATSTVPLGSATDSWPGSSPAKGGRSRSRSSRSPSLGPSPTPRSRPPGWFRGAPSGPSRAGGSNCFFPSGSLHGFDPETNRRLGFYYQATDPDRGDQYLGVGREFPVGEDPSLWATLCLAE